GYGWVAFDPTPAGGGGGTAQTSWFWPGRILFDGIQHRWSKWVLDYGPDDQIGLLSRWSDFLGGDDAPQAASGGAGAAGPERPWAVPLGILAPVLLGWLWLRQPPGPLAPSARLYLALRSAAARAGVTVSPGLTAEGLLDGIRALHPSAAAPAAFVVEQYQRARWGGGTVGPGELQDMQRALDSARSVLR